MTLPVGVMRNRLLAPLWVFIFIDGLGTLLTSFLGAFPIRRAGLRPQRGHKHDHRAAFHPRRLLDHTVGTELIGKLIEKGLPQVGVSHFATAEQDRKLNFIPGVEELGRLSPFRLEVVVVDLRPDANFFQLDDVLIPTRLALLAALLVPVLAVIHQPADRRHGVGCYLDEVEPSLTRHLERIKGRNDANLLALFVNEPNLANADALVDAGLDGSRNSLPPKPLYGLCSTQERAGINLRRGRPNKR